MPIALDLFGLIVSFEYPLAVVLSTWIGTGGCGCPISSSATSSDNTIHAHNNNAAISTTAAEETKFLIILL